MWQKIKYNFMFSCVKSIRKYLFTEVKCNRSGHMLTYKCVVSLFSTTAICLRDGWKSFLIKKKTHLCIFIELSLYDGPAMHFNIRLSQRNLSFIQTARGYTNFFSDNVWSFNISDSFVTHLVLPVQSSVGLNNWI